MLAAVPVETADGQEYVQDGELYFYLTKRLPDGFCKEYLNTFAALYPKLPRQIIHRDSNPGNIICADDQWGFNVPKYHLRL